MAKGQTHRRIHKIKIGDGQSAESAIAYLADAQANGDYYTEGGSAVMLWLATDRARTFFALGPRGGDVSRQTMAALLNGLHPTTGKKIRKEGKDGTMVGGTDIVMNPAPKSVSVLWAVAGDELRRQLEVDVYLSSTRAIHRMLRELPMVRDTVAGFTRPVKAEDWVGVQAIHTTARLTAHKGVPDPQLHVHNVLFGALSFDGRLRALDSLPMTRYHRELDAEAASDLAERLRLMGFPIRRVVDRNSIKVIKSVKFELDGVPDSLVEAMSARSREIGDLRKQYEKENGRPAEGPGWEKFVADHRGAKAKLTPAVMHAAWHDEADEHGFNRAAIADYVRRAEDAKAAGVEERGPTGWAAEQLRRELLAEVCREHALVPETDVNRLVMQLSIGLLGPAAAGRVLAKMYGAGDLLATTDGKVTTLEVLAQEQRAERAARRLLEAEPGPAVEPADLEREYRRAEEEGRPFDPWQRRAVALAVSGSRLVSVSGPAGTGKSDPSDAMTAIWQGQGRRVIATAVYGLTAQKAQADSGSDDGDNLTMLLIDIDRGKLRLEPSDVMFVDEAAVIGHRQYAALLEAVADAGATLVQAGDDKQLSPIEAGGLWTVIHEMADQEEKAAELRVIHRARNPEEGEAWTDVRAGRVREGLNWYRDQGLIRLYDTRHQLLEGMVEEWWTAGWERGGMIVDTSNAERDELNAMAQARRLEAGQLGVEALTLASGREIRAGDRVLFTAPYPPAPARRTSPAASASPAPGQPAKRVVNGTEATVVSVDLDAGTAVVRLHEPKPKGRRGAKSQAATLPADREVVVPASAPIELGYCRHVVKAQGMTVDVANVATGPATDHNDLYTMVSRSRDGTRVHAVRAEIEEMGMDPGDLARPAGEPNMTGADVVAQLQARDTAPPAMAQVEARHLYPAERVMLQRLSNGPEGQTLPPGARPWDEFFADVARERVAVPREDPASWEATRDEIARRAERSSTKHAIGHPIWLRTTAKESMTEAAWESRELEWHREQSVASAEVKGRQAGKEPSRARRDREPVPAPLPGRDGLDTAARDHSRWGDAAKVLASYAVAGRLDITSAPAEQAARRWLDDPRALIVVADKEQEQLVRDAVVRLLRASESQAATRAAHGTAEDARESHGATLDGPTLAVPGSPPPPGEVTAPSFHPGDGHPMIQVAASDLNHALLVELDSLPPAAAEYARGLAALPPQPIHLDEPRVWIAKDAYAIREARRGALGLGSSHPVVEPDVELRAYVVAPIAPGSGWSYRDMTRALSVAATTHLISPPPSEKTADDARREVVALQHSLDADRHAEQVRQATLEAELADGSRAREIDRAPERVREAGTARP